MLALIPLVGLVYFTSQVVWEKLEVARELDVLHQYTDLSVKLSAFVHESQKERGFTAGFVASNGQKFSVELSRQRDQTNEQLEELKSFLDSFDPENAPSSFKKVFGRARQELDHLESKRASISNLSISTADAIGYYTGLHAQLLGLVSEVAKVSHEADISLAVTAYANFLLAKERNGVERAVMNGVFVKNAFSGDTLRRFTSLVAEQTAYTHAFTSLATDEQNSFYTSKMQNSAVEDVARMEALAFEKASEGDFGVDPSYWVKTITAKINVLKVVEDHLADDLESLMDNVRSAATRSLTLNIVIGLLSLIVTLIAGAMVAKSILRPVNQAISELSVASQEINEASSEVFGASNSLSDGASNQASSLEETSASLEEMSAMTRQNADNTRHATALAKDVGNSAQESQVSIENLSAAIGSIKNSADETAKIVKTIDEIAFQTNLLALNAAVEAARAGDAGKGFAVVAEEVRSLAQRSAEAAKNTAVLIDESQGNAERGVTVSKEVEAVLKEIITGVQKINGVISEVAVASEEQAKGIAQINDSVAQMDQITQSNAAHSEQTAATSRELSSQSQDLSSIVQALSTIIHGASASLRGSGPAVLTNGDAAKRLVKTRSKAAASPTTAQPAAATAGPSEKQAAVLEPAKIIPLNDGDLENF